VPPFGFQLEKSQLWGLKKKKERETLTEVKEKDVRGKKASVGSVTVNLDEKKKRLGKLYL